MILYESQYYGVQIMDFDPIVHHGIKGQKWGVTNGPPYPLGFKARERVREKAKQIKAKLSGNKSSGGKKHGLSDKTKGRIKTGLKVAGTAAVVGAAAYGAYKLSDLGVSGTDIKQLEAGVQSAKSAIADSKSGISGSVNDLIETDELTGFKKIQGTLTQEQYRSRSNESHQQYNCKESSLSYAMQKIRGIDVTAQEKPFKGNLTEFVEHYFENGSDKTVYIACDASNAKERLEKNILRRFNDGDVGAFNITFDKKYLRPGSSDVTAHTISCERIGDSVKFVDSQGDEHGNSRENKIASWLSRIDPTKEIELVNYSKLTPKKDVIHEALKERK